MSGVLGTVTSFLEQRFATLPTSIVGQGVALYKLAVISPGTSGTSIPGLTYTFPISPQAIRKEPSNLNTIYDVQGGYKTGGVERLVDMWGITPPIYTIRGTTGWKRHSMDQFALTGKQSIARIQDILDAFASLNQQLMAKNATDYYSLELYDFWSREYWSIVPVGPTTIEQSAQAPTIYNYTFRWAAVKAVESPIPAFEVDALTIAFSIGAQQIQIANSYLTQTLAKY